MSPADSETPQEQVTVTDKRRIDPETGEVRTGAAGPAPSGPAPAVPAETDEVADLRSTLQRVKAEYDNFRKRALRDQDVAAERAKAAVVSELLGVLDDLDRARSHGDLESGPLKSVADKLTGALSSLGLASFGCAGEDFDPEHHEAVQHDRGDSEDGHPVIATVLRRGYELGGRVLRHAMVAVVDTAPAGGGDETTDATSAQYGESETPSD